VNKIVFGDCRNTMRKLAKDGVKVQMCVTSPPYYGLRDYGTSSWEGGDPDCKHSISMPTKWNDPKRGTSVLRPEVSHRGGDASHCHLCGAKRIDLQIGLEETPEQYIEAMVEVFRCVKNILADDGVLWVNIGDSYAMASMRGENSKFSGQVGAHKGYENGSVKLGKRSIPFGIKAKDLIGIPWMLAFALRADGWYLRQDIIWHKPNPMPESVQDRCTKAHEYIFLLSKSPKYFYDNEAIKVPVKEDWGTRDRTNGKYHNEGTGLQPHSGLEKSYDMANKRSVWSVNTKPYSGAHFAVFPEELIEPCILAGTSQKGHCPKCYARWVRDIERVTSTSSECPKTQSSHEARGGMGKATGTVGKSGGGRINGYTTTLGWIPSCNCGVDPIADIVFDPFMGSGTTAQVAQQLGRKYLGCELNPDYKPLQNKRVAQFSLELI
jgi:DNA modification methylase